MTRVAIPHWQGRVSPVFDVAGRLLLADVSDGRIERRDDLAVAPTDPRARAAVLGQAGVDVLVCGAISLPMESAIEAAGVEIIPQICGEVDEVLAAYVDGRLGQGAYLMPGCCGRRRRMRAGRGRGRGRRRTEGQW